MKEPLNNLQTRCLLVLGVREREDLDGCVHAHPRRKPVLVSSPMEIRFTSWVGYPRKNFKPRPILTSELVSFNLTSYLHPHSTPVQNPGGVLDSRAQKFNSALQHPLSLLLLGQQPYVGVRQNPGSQVNIAHLPVPLGYGTDFPCFKLRYGTRYGCVWVCEQTCDQKT